VRHGAICQSALRSPRTTSYNRFVRWRKASVWGRMMDAITAAYDGNIQMIDSTSAPPIERSGKISKVYGKQLRL
jgi:transposase